MAHAVLCMNILFNDVVIASYALPSHSSAADSKTTPAEKEMKYSTEQFKNAAVSIIQQHNSSTAAASPLFLYVWIDNVAFILLCIYAVQPIRPLLELHRPQFIAFS